MQTKRPDQDMVKVSELLSEARALAAHRNWRTIQRGLDETLAALLRVTPGNGEKVEAVKFRPVERALAEESNGIDRGPRRDRERDDEERVR